MSPNTIAYVTYLPTQAGLLFSACHEGAWYYCRTVHEMQPARIEYNMLMGAVIANKQSL